MNLTSELTTKGVSIVGKVLFEPAGGQRASLPVPLVLVVTPVLVVIDSTSVGMSWFLAWWRRIVRRLALVLGLMRCGASGTLVGRWSIVRFLFLLMTLVWLV
jgi:hypothetical protein